MGKKARARQLKARRQPTAQKPRLRFWVAVGVVILGTVLIRQFYVRWNYAENYIERKAADKTVNTRYSPVLIYSQYEREGAWYFEGSGSLIRTPQGTENVVTVEHLCRPGKGKVVFGYRTLRPYEKDVTHGISMLYNGAQLGAAPGEHPDLMVMQGIRTANWQNCPSNRVRKITRNSLFGTIEGGQVLTSIVSGEKIQVLGYVEAPEDGGVDYLIARYPNRGGESGSGFVDQEDNLYVLIGKFDGLTLANKDQQKHFGDTQSLSILYGKIAPKF